MTIQQEQNKNLSDITLSAFSFIILSREETLSRLKKILEVKPRERDILLKRLLSKNTKIFTEMYNPVKNGVINSYNIGTEGWFNKFAKQYNIKMPTPTILKGFKKDDPFKITRKYLNKTSITKRGLINSKKLNNIIKEGYKKGWGYDTTARKIETSIGYRSKVTGRLTQGAGKNGIHYQTTRIARQETRRMNGIAQHDSYLKAREKGAEARLLIQARIITTSRLQSIQMSGQKDGELYGTKGNGVFNKRYAGKFQYPDGNWYTFGQAPVKWSINDREFVLSI